MQSPRAHPRHDAVAMLQHVQRYKYGRRSPIVLRRHADRQTDRQTAVGQTDEADGIRRGRRSPAAAAAAVSGCTGCTARAET